jgi:hypothetical protein
MRNFANWSENDTFHLFAIPGKDNFAGIKYNLDILKQIEFYDVVKLK